MQQATCPLAVRGVLTAARMDGFPAEGFWRNPAKLRAHHDAAPIATGQHTQHSINNHMTDRLMPIVDMLCSHARTACAAKRTFLPFGVVPVWMTKLSADAAMMRERWRSWCCGKVSTCNGVTKMQVEN